MELYSSSILESIAIREKRDNMKNYSYLIKETQQNLTLRHLRKLRQN